MRTAPAFVAPVVAGTGLFPGPAIAQTQAAPATQSEHRRADAVLQQAARFEHRVTGVTSRERGRIFVNFPRWTDDSPVSLAEVMKNGSVRPYPNQQWNAWRNVRYEELDPSTHVVCVLSVVADGRGNVWVVDPPAPAVQGIVPGGPKLVRIDRGTDRVAQVIRFGQDVAIPGSCLNDVRFSNDRKHAYLTEAGQRGALVRTEGKPLRFPDGRSVVFAADSIALSSDGAWLYWKALTGTTLYGIQTTALTGRSLAAEDLSGQVQPYGKVGPTDGLWIGRGTDTLYLTSQGRDGSLYVTTSRIQDSASSTAMRPRACRPSCGACPGHATVVRTRRVRPLRT